MKNFIEKIVISPSCVFLVFSYSPTPIANRIKQKLDSRVASGIFLGFKPHTKTLFG